MYEYRIPCVNGKPLVNIPSELRENAKEMVYGSDEIKIISDELVDPMLYDPNVKVIDLSIGQEIKSLLGDYLNPPVADVVITKDDSYVYAMRPSNNYKGYILLDKGEAGTDINNPGEDSKVLQNAYNYLESNYSTISHLIFDNNEYYIGNIQVKTSVYTIGGNINLIDDGFTIYNGSLDNKPDFFGFEHMFINGNMKNVFKFRYCSDWLLYRITAVNTSRFVQLERTWGNNQLMLNCSIKGSPGNDSGLVHILSPTSDNTNSFTLNNVSFYVFNNGEYGIYTEDENTWNCNIINCYQEGKGSFLGGNSIKYYEFIDCQYLGDGYFLDLTDYIRYCQVQNCRFTGIVANEISETDICSCNVVYNLGDRYFIKLSNGIHNYISNIKFEQTISQNPLIYISGGWYDDITISDLSFFGVQAPYMIYIGSTGRNRGIYIENTKFRNLNPNGTLTSCYALYSEGNVVVCDNIKFFEINNYEIYNSRSLFRIYNIGGQVLPEFSVSGLSVTLGDNTYGSPTVFTPVAGFISNFNLILHYTVAAGDTVYAKVTTVYENAGETTGVIKEVANSGTTTINKDISLDVTDLQKLWVNNDRLLQVKVYGNSETGSSTSALTFDIFGSS